MSTDVDGVYLDWGKPGQRRLDWVSPEELAGYEFAAGSMGPKAEAAARFAAKTGRRAAIGSLADIAETVARTAGTNVVRPQGFGTPDPTPRQAGEEVRGRWVPGGKPERHRRRSCT